MTVQEIVKKAIADNKVMVFSKSYCPYCTMAKKALDQYVKDYTVMELENRSDAADIQKILGELTGESTVPRVFIDGKFVGGGSECVALAKNGKLQKLLEDSGVTLLEASA